MANPQLCTRPGCAIPGRHQDGCDTDQCPGCLTALAADGLRLCTLHTRRIGADARDLAKLHRELELRLVGSDRPGEKTSGSRSYGLTINEPVIDVRTEIAHVLAAWCRLIAEQRGIHLPWVWDLVHVPEGHYGPPRLVQHTAESVPSLARYVDTHSTWLAASEYAADISTELDDLARRARRYAHPSGTRLIDVCPCPMPQCAGSVRAVMRPTDSLLPSELACTESTEHTWPSSSWRRLARAVGSAPSAPATQPARCSCACHIGGAYRPACTIGGDTGCGSTGCDGRGNLTAAAA